MPARTQEQLASASRHHMQLHAHSETADAVQVPEAATGASNYCKLLVLALACDSLEPAARSAGTLCRTAV